MGSEDTVTVGLPTAGTAGAESSGLPRTAPTPSSRCVTAGTAQSAAELAARSARHLTASQVRSPGSVMRPGPGRPTEPRPVIHEDVLDHMVAARDEIIEHARAVIPADEVRRPMPRDTAGAVMWLGEHTPHLGEAARRASEALLLRQHLENRLMAGDLDAIRPHRCLNCRCWSLQWYRELRVAVCVNLRCSGEDGRPSRFTLQQIAAKAVETLTIRAAT